MKTLIKSLCFCGNKTVSMEINKACNLINCPTFFVFLAIIKQVNRRDRRGGHGECSGPDAGHQRWTIS